MAANAVSFGRRILLVFCPLCSKGCDDVGLQASSGWLCVLFFERSTMRIAAIYDIHGNAPALEAVFQDIAREHVNLIVVGGDVLAGPMPSETLALLLDCKTPMLFIRGNADREIVAALLGEDISHMPKIIREIIVWVAQQLEPQDLNLLSSWPETQDQWAG
jgi:hypothetical protein